MFKLRTDQFLSTVIVILVLSYFISFLIIVTSGLSDLILNKQSLICGTEFWTTEIKSLVQKLVKLTHLQHLQIFRCTGEKNCHTLTGSNWYSEKHIFTTNHKPPIHKIYSWQRKSFQYILIEISNKDPYNQHVSWRKESSFELSR